MKERKRERRSEIGTEEGKTNKERRRKKKKVGKTERWKEKDWENKTKVSHTCSVIPAWWIWSVTWKRFYRALGTVFSSSHYTVFLKSTLNHWTHLPKELRITLKHVCTISLSLKQVQIIWANSEKQLGKTNKKLLHGSFYWDIHIITQRSGVKVMDIQCWGKEHNCITLSGWESTWWLCSNT